MIYPRGLEGRGPAAFTGPGIGPVTSSQNGKTHNLQDTG